MDSFDLGLFQSGLVQRLGRNSDTCIDQLDRLGNRSIPCRTGSSFYLNSLRSSGVFGSQVAEGTGEAVLGHPINSLVWLANKLADYGKQLRAGEIIMTGSLTRQFGISKGDTIKAKFLSLIHISEPTRPY